MKIKELTSALERFAPLPLQESYDNAGLQVGLTEAEASGALLCLDVTEKVIYEAVNEGFNMIISHHPLLFHGLKTISDADFIQRCVRKAIRHDITIYSAHTNLDNAVGGVNFRIAEKLGLEKVDFLEPKQVMVGGVAVRGGSGVVGELPSAMATEEFLRVVKSAFSVVSLQYNALLDRKIRKVALCGGSGSFLVTAAKACGADAFLTGEMGYHDFFGHNGEIQLGVLGHYQSEQYTQELLYSIIQEAFPQLPLKITVAGTNPINYL